MKKLFIILALFASCKAVEPTQMRITSIRQEQYGLWRICGKPNAWRMYCGNFDKVPDTVRVGTIIRLGDCLCRDSTKTLNKLIRVL